MNSHKRPRHLRAFTAFSVLLISINGMAFAPGAFADGDQSSGSDLNFGSSQKWSIVPSGTPDAKPRERRNSESSFAQPSSGSFTPLPASSVPKSNWSMSPSANTGNTGSQSSSSKQVTESKPLKLYGRIEELTYSTGAKIPLKLQAMAPIRDTSRDIKPSKLAGNVGANSAQLSGMMPGKPDVKITKLSGQTDSTLLTGKVREDQESFPIDYRGNWTGNLRVSLVNFGQNYYDFDRKEAEKQARLITPGIDGKCTVTFYQGSDNKINVRPTQVVFTIMTNLADEAKDLANTPFGAMLGGANAANMLQGMNMPIPFALPLGVMSGNTGVTGNQLNSDLVKIDLKEIAKGVLEEQLVTHDSERNSSGQMRDYYTESVMRFNRINNDSIAMQAASVSYDNQGNYMSKIIMGGTLYRGGSTDATPQTYTMFGGNQGQDGQGGGAANPLQSLFGGAGGDGGANGAGSLFGGGNNGNGQGGGLLDQVQQMQKLMQDLNSQ